MPRACKNKGCDKPCYQKKTLCRECMRVKWRDWYKKNKRKRFLAKDTPLPIFVDTTSTEFICKNGYELQAHYLGKAGGIKFELLHGSEESAAIHLPSERVDDLADWLISRTF